MNPAHKNQDLDCSHQKYCRSAVKIVYIPFSLSPLPIPFAAMTFPLVLLNKAAAAAVVVSLMMMVPDSRRSSISGAHAFAITQQQFQHQQTAHAATTPTPHTGGGSATSTTSTTTIVSTTRLRSTVFSEAEMLALISDPAYAVDIRSTSGTGSIDKETLFGQTSGVSDDDDNDGTAVSAQRRSSAIATWFQNAVGRIFTWKNKPIYEKLWTIIEDDCLALIQQKIPELQPRRTWFDSAGPDDGNDDVVAKATTASAATPHSFVSADGTCQGTVAAYRGGRVDWLTTCRFFSKALGFGIMRIDGWTTRCDTRAPHMAVHLCIIMNVMFIYITLVPRSNLVLDDEYNDYGMYIRAMIVLTRYMVVAVSGLVLCARVQEY